MARGSKVVDFQQFRASRQEAEVKRLPLFDGPEPVRPAAGAAAERHLSAREVTHRERMLRHLRVSAIGDR